LLFLNVYVDVWIMGVVIESAYFLLGSPACIDLVERDLPLFPGLFFEDDLDIIYFSLNKERFSLYSKRVTIPGAKYRHLSTLPFTYTAT